MAEVLGVISSIVAILEISGTVLEYVHRIKSASEDSDRILLEISSINGFLSSLKELISRAESQNIWLDTVRSLNAPKGPISQYTSALWRLEEKLKPVVGWRKAGKAVRWPFEKTEILEILDGIERQKTLFMLALQNDSARLSLSIEAGVSEIQAELSRLRSGIDEMAITSRDDKMATVYAWLDPLAGDFEKKQADVFNLEGRQDGICHWLLSTQEFADWSSGARKILWCTGNPGIGKTIVSGWVIDYLHREYRHNSTTAIVFLYCNYKDSDRQTVRNMMASVLHQLALQQPQIAEALEIMFEQHRHRNSQPSLTELQEFLNIASNDFQRINVVMDALDEYTLDSLPELLSRIQALSSNMFCFLASRASLHLDLEDLTHLTIEADVTDIENYINGRLQTSNVLTSMIRKDPTLRTQIVETVMGRAKGMFLLVKLYVQVLQTKTNARKLKAALNTLPDGEEQTYDELLVRIQNQHSDHATLAMSALSWIVNARRPLFMEELLYALAIEPGDTTLDPDGISDAELLISVCAGIVSFEPESRVVGLVHYTAQEYFTRKGSNLFPGAQKQMSLICLTALNFYEARKHYYPAIDEDKPLLQLSQYAVPYWADHMRESQDDTLCEELALEFVCSRAELALETVRLQDAGILNLLELRHLAYSASGLCALSALGLEKAMISLIHEDLRLRSCDSEALDCALLYAVFYGRATSVLSLLEEGANVNSRNHTETALHYAAYKGDAAVAELLLDHKAHVDVVADISPLLTQHLHPGQSHHGYSALHLAASLGHQEIVALLLQREASATLPDCDGNTALHLAVAADAFDVTKVLLDTNVRRKSVVNSSYREISSCTDHIAHDPNQPQFVNAVNKMKQTALHVASFFNSHKVVPLLIEAGAGIDLRDHVNNTPLLIATWRRDAQISIVRALLEAGCDVNHAGNINGESQNAALHLAIEPAKYEILQLLLQHGANPNVRNGSGSTPMHLATWLGSGMRVYEVLLQAGADINTQDLRGNTVLHLAVIADDSSIIQSLLDNGAKADTRNGEGKTALDVAIQWKTLYPCGLEPDDPNSVVNVLKQAGPRLTEQPGDLSDFVVLNPQG